MAEPAIILVFSGKRKSGKDYITDLLKHRLTADRCAVLRLSGPLKKQYAEEHKLDYARLLEATDYKERYRSDMIRWGEERRDADPGYFCRLVVESDEALAHRVWIVSDARRRTDVTWFRKRYGGRVRTVRVVTDDDVREQRGWVFTQGVDDAPSECALDEGVDFDFVITNNGHDAELESALKDLEQLVLTACESMTS